MNTKFQIRKLLGIGGLATGLLMAGQPALAQIDGVYKSDQGDECLLTVTPDQYSSPEICRSLLAHGVARCCSLHVGWRRHFHVY